MTEPGHQDGPRAGEAIPNPYRDHALPAQDEAPAAPRTRWTRIQMLPLRTWLVVIIVVVSGLGLAASSVAVSSIMRDVMYSRVDDDLIASLDGWASSSEIFKADESSRPPSDYSVIKIFPDGSSIIFNDRGGPPKIGEVVIGGPPQTVGSVPGATHSTEWRVVAVHEGGVTTVVAKSLDREHTLLYRLALVQGVISALVLAIVALLGYYFIRRALQPLREVERTAGAIAAGELDRRVPAWPQETEVGQLSVALNMMLGRLQGSVEDARDKEEQMRRFVGDASHELRTPLTSVRGYTELYRSGATDDVDRVLSKIDDESKRMSLLVEDLLALTRAEGSRLEKKPVDLLELSLSAASSARAAFAGREVTVANETSSIPLVDGDPDRLHQVLLNLIGNGLVHGGPEAKVNIRLRLDNGEVLIDIEDDGRGMAAEDAARIFDRFYRADSSRSRTSGGSGLGLAITKSLVTKHEGTITVDSVEGEGTTFTIRLPRLPEE